MDEHLTFFAQTTEISLDTATAQLRPDLEAAGVCFAPNGRCVLVGLMCNLPLGSNPWSSGRWFEV